MTAPARFDRAAVVARLDRTRAELLARFGAAVRAQARAAVRPGGPVSRPGEPPASHTGRFPDSIRFAVDPAGGSVVAGPVAFRGGSRVASALEHGGAVARGGRVLHYRPRPVMGPAFRAVLQSRLAAELRAAAD